MMELCLGGGAGAEGAAGALLAALFALFFRSTSCKAASIPPCLSTRKFQSAFKFTWNEQI